MSTVRMELIGDDALKRKLKPAALAAGPARRLLTRSAVAVQGEARERANVDRGQWRNSIAYEVRGGEFPDEAVVGSNLDHAWYAHFGRRPGKMPPKGAMLGWMRRHRIPADKEYVIRRAIGRHGTEGDHALTEGLDAAKPAIRGYVVACAREIESEGGR